MKKYLWNFRIGFHPALVVQMMSHPLLVDWTLTNKVSHPFLSGLDTVYQPVSKRQATKMVTGLLAVNKDLLEVVMPFRLYCSIRDVQQGNTIATLYVYVCVYEMRKLNQYTNSM